MSSDGNNNLNKGSTPRILAIETSCDETAIAYMQGLHAASHHVHTQAALHAEFGGVFPNLAKREHVKNLVPVLSLVFHDIFNIPVVHNSKEAHSTPDIPKNINPEVEAEIREILGREQGLDELLLSYINSISHEDFESVQNSIDAIAVTFGPGLEPALWVGISFAKALAIIFNKPLLPINHMEGHIASVLAESTTPHQSEIQFPAIALLISGGHTELVHIESWHQYAIIGATVDDAVGEAYDKAARQLGLPYPGGPEISKLAEIWRSKHISNNTDTATSKYLFNLPRPMIHSKDLNFSFSGLKTAVLYAIRDHLKAQGQQELSSDEKISLAGEFEEAVIDVLVAKTKKALNEYGAKSLIIGGGVIANTAIRKAFETLTTEHHVSLHVPEKNLSTDNAAMIGIVGILQYIQGVQGRIPHTQAFNDLHAEGNLSL